MKHLLALLFVLLTWPATGQDSLPALFDVRGVAADDVLNVRTSPSARGTIVGTFAPFETGIEVIARSDDGKWGRVNVGEQAGWASLRYLARQPGQDAEAWSAGLAPMTLECFGTEPFWNLTLTPGGTLDYSAIDIADGAAQPGGYERISTSASTGKRGFYGWLTDEALGLTGIVATELCTDGMSDRDYGFAIDLVVNDETGVGLAGGCCRLVR